MDAPVLFDIVPGSHNVQTVLLYKDVNIPSEHNEHTELPIVFEKVPGLQAIHVDLWMEF